MSFSEHALIEEWEPTVWPPRVQAQACAFPYVRTVVIAAVGLALCAGLAGVWLIQKIRPW